MNARDKENDPIETLLILKYGSMKNAAKDWWAPDCYNRLTVEEYNFILEYIANSSVDLIS